MVKYISPLVAVARIKSLLEVPIWQEDIDVSEAIHLLDELAQWLEKAVVIGDRPEWCDSIACRG